MGLANVHRTLSMIVCLRLTPLSHGLQQRGHEKLELSWDPFAAITDTLNGGSKKESNTTTIDVVNASAANETNVVEIAMYYEALCPYCRNIIGGSLAMLWNDTEFHDRINVSLYPYGNARTLEKESVSEGYRYWHQELQTAGFDYVYACQHGTDECFGNMLHACAIKHFGNESVPFIMCMEADEAASAERSSYICAESLALDLDPVRECVVGKEGNGVMMAQGVATEALAKPAGPREYVPWIVVDGTHCATCEEDGEDGGEKGSKLLTQVCGLLTEPKPSLCTGSTKGNFREVLGHRHKAAPQKDDTNHKKNNMQHKKHTEPAELSRI